MRNLHTFLNPIVFYSSVLIIPAIGYIINAIICYFLFKKAGEQTSKAFIPYYSTFVLFKIIDLSQIWFWISIALSISGNIINVLKNVFNVPSFLFASFGIVSFLLGVIIHFMESDQLGNSFGKTKGFKVGYFFLPMIFGFILAFGESQYIGPNGVRLSKKKRNKA